MNLLSDFFSLFFPKTCMACGNSLYRNEEMICTQCLFHLPKTNFHLEKINPVSKVFWGRTNIEMATALYFYRKESKVQTLIHHLKYHGNQEIGVFLGQLYGGQLKDSEYFKDVDVVIPIPLHKDKLKKRGFNQAESFASGLAETMKAIIDTTSVYRDIATSTQTKKSRYKRWENVSEIFKIKETTALENKHVLIVDDVITTGATMEACINTLNTVEGIKVSVAAIAFAAH
ncbi:MAG: ComF family protein [Bacteroidetes bacterium]|nr:MAG: ComF family protein [Bacteroidota bacterium]